MKYPEQKRALNVDVIFESGNKDAYYAVQGVQLVLKKIEEFPELRALAVLFKKLLHIKQLNVPYFGILPIKSLMTNILGGMGSYVLVLILYAFLNTSPVYESSAHSFLEFLKYYGTEFDSNSMLVSEGGIETVRIDGMLLESQVALYVADPFRPELNAAANVLRFREIQSYFKKLFETLMKIKEEYNHSTTQGDILPKMFG